VGLGVVLLAAGVTLTPLGGYLTKRLTDAAPVVSRLYSFTIAVEMIEERPWLGWGYDYYEAGYYDHVLAFQRRHRSAARSQKEAERYDYILTTHEGTPPKEVHNDLLETAVDCGLLGVFALFGLALTFATSAARAARLATDKRDSALLALIFSALLCMGIDGLFGFTLRLPCSAMLFWGLLGIGSRLSRDTVPAASET
jgi:O-antigen ligase